MGLRQRQDAHDTVEESDRDPDVQLNQVEEETKSETKDCQRHGTRRGGHDFCRTFLGSKLWKGMTLCVVGFTPVFGVFRAVPEMFDAIGIVPWTLPWVLNYCFAAWISTQFLYNFIATQWTDAGGCKSIKPSQEVTGQFQLGGQDNGLDLLYAPNWCAKCSHWKPPRSHHCSTSKRCILRMDHHCPFTGNVIGARNHGHFILFYIFAVIGLIYSLLLSGTASMSTDHITRWQDLMIPTMKEYYPMLEKHFMTGLAAVWISIAFQVAQLKGVAVIIQLVATILALIPVLATGCPAFYLAWTNTTTMERIFPMKEYVQIKEQVYCPLGPGFYRLSGLENLKTIMGKRWWRRFLLPIPGELDMDRILMPQPSPEGCQALKERIQQVQEKGVTQEVRNCEELGFNPGPKTDQTV